MLVESVPNVSLGPQDPALESVVGEVKAATSPGCSLLDVHTDPDHRRSVLTLAGAPSPLARVLDALAGALEEHASLTGHEGVHPRVGLLDVVPLVTLASPQADTERVVDRTSHRLSARGVPVYLYARSARHRDRRRLSWIRARLEEASPGEPPAVEPDLGPSILHPEMGAACVGMRDPLVAYNVLLDSEDLSRGRKIAREIRSRDGGLPGVQALAFGLASQGGQVQISTNITDVDDVGTADVYRAVSEQAKKHGLSALEGELVGLAPERSLPGDPAEMGLDQAPESLETRLEQAGYELTGAL